MKITSFNPLIVTKDAEAAIAVFEALGFEKRHTKEGISINDVTNVRMKDANGFHVDVTQGDGEWTMIRMNVDNLEEAIEFLEKRLLYFRPFAQIEIPGLSECNRATQHGGCQQYYFLAHIYCKNNKFVL